MFLATAVVASTRGRPRARAGRRGRAPARGGRPRRGDRAGAARRGQRRGGAAGRLARLADRARACRTPRSCSAPATPDRPGCPAARRRPRAERRAARAGRPATAARWTRLRERVAPALEALLSAALDRDALQAEVVETHALRRSDVIKTALLRAVSHDLRTPLTAILAAGDAVRSPSRSSAGERDELGALVVDEAQRLSRLVEQAARPLAAPGRRGRAAARLVLDRGGRPHGALEHLADARRRAASRLTLDRDLPLVQADAAQLERVFVEPARERAPLLRRPSGQGPRARGRRARLTIRVDRPRPRHRRRAACRTSSSRSGRAARRPTIAGSGLGLAIVKGFVEANGGRVWAESLPGQGTVFAIELPLAEQPAGARVTPAGARVLVCDDEPQIAARAEDRPARGGLRRRRRPRRRRRRSTPPRCARPTPRSSTSCCPTATASTSAASCARGAGCRSSCCRRSGDEDQKVAALEAGRRRLRHQAVRPARAGRAAARGAAPRRQRRVDEPTIAVDGLEIDLAARVVRRDGAEVHLTPIEYDLLRALVRNRGRLMTHRTLLTEVWGPQYADDTQVLRTHIANLRRKIEPPGGAAPHPHRRRASATASAAERLHEILMPGRPDPHGSLTPPPPGWADDGQTPPRGPRAGARGQRPVLDRLRQRRLVDLLRARPRRLATRSASRRSSS